MKKVVLSASLLLLAAAAAAQGPPGLAKPKIVAPESFIVVTVNGLNCTTAAGTNTFAAQAWSWGAANTETITSTGGGGGAGQAKVGSLNVEKKFDACSPALFGAVVSGKHFNTLTLTQEDSNHNILLTLTLSDALVSSWQVSGAQNSEFPMESVSFNFRKICISETSSGSKFCYDAATGTTN